MARLGRSRVPALGRPQRELSIVARVAIRKRSRSVEANKPVVLALANALVDHPERTLNSTEIAISALASMVASSWE
jgi:hypothetical protein